MNEGTRAWQARVAEGRPHHGLGASTYFPGNVCHLVSPIVGHLRLMEHYGETDLDAKYLAYLIDRLSMVIELAEEQVENDNSTP